ncbi:hypothetical protein EC973_003334 [Apophysomyces ossiformis]|uniref:Fatty acid hydroxylase domain-containing protein n=1 Tax=Apophysomyces ossiformis TaxID=679940 RepID=A0A8H7BY89_9FUNG|nr:hypothetical protein EC973_003334 [Apophysomyces ossiformis]
MRAEVPFFEQYRIHPSSDMTKRNKASFRKVLLMVALQHAVQFCLGMVLLRPTDPNVKRWKEEAWLQYFTSLWFGFVHNKGLAHSLAQITQNIIIPSVQFFTAMVIVDFHQYVLHRMAHHYQFLYKHFHSHHHRLYVPYAFGALYNHPVEGFMLDTVGAALAFEITCMSAKMGMVFFTFSNLKTIGDHCGYIFPWDPLNALFGNNAIYHDIHHQPYGIKKNFAQPFFTFWDRTLGTMYTEEDAAKQRKIKSTKSN